MLNRIVPATSGRVARTGFRADAGVGLVEVLISVLIFSTAILGIVGTSARVGMYVNSAHVRLAAEAAARQQIENLLAKPYAEVVDGTAADGDVWLNWSVTESLAAKKVVLVYGYDLRGRARVDTVTASVVRP